MRSRSARHSRRASLLLAGTLAVLPLAACSESGEPDQGATAESTGTASTTTAESTDATPSEATDQADDPGQDTDGGTESDVDCSGTSCSVTLSGDGAEAEILGTRVVLGGVDNGQATFRIGDEEVTCGEGDSTSAGPITLECSSVTDDQVTMTASLG